MDTHNTTRGYQSQRGFRMWGGQQLPQAEPRPFGWLSFGLLVGVAAVLGTWFALFA